MKRLSNKFLCRAGVVSIVAGAGVLFAPGSTVASAASAKTAKAAASAPTCHDQPNRSYKGHEVLESYWFTIQHNGHTTVSCTTFGKVDQGDIVTAHLDVADSNGGTEITLLTNQAPGNGEHQTLFDCASFNDDGGGGDSCLSAKDPALTVDVPKCGFQIDLIYGDALQKVELGDYGGADRFIDGQIDRSDDVCLTASHPSPAPGGGGGAPVPGTGAGFDPGAQGVIGTLLLLSGGGAVVYGIRRRRSAIVP